MAAALRHTPPGNSSRRAGSMFVCKSVHPGSGISTIMAGFCDKGIEAEMDAAPAQVWLR